MMLGPIPQFERMSPDLHPISDVRAQPPGVIES
jgi:hypothetical protein